MKKYSIVYICLCVIIAAVSIYKIAGSKDIDRKEFAPTENGHHENNIAAGETSVEEIKNTMPFVELSEDDEDADRQSENKDTTVPTEAQIPDNNMDLGENDTDWVELVD